MKHPDCRIKVKIFQNYNSFIRHEQFRMCWIHKICRSPFSLSSKLRRVPRSRQLTSWFITGEMRRLAKIISLSLSFAILQFFHNALSIRWSLDVVPSTRLSINTTDTTRIVLWPCDRPVWRNIATLFKSPQDVVRRCRLRCVDWIPYIPHSCFWCNWPKLARQEDFFHNFIHLVNY